MEMREQLGWGIASKPQAQIQSKATFFRKEHLFESQAADH